MAKSAKPKTKKELDLELMKKLQKLLRPMKIKVMPETLAQLRDFHINPTDRIHFMRLYREGKPVCVMSNAQAARMLGNAPRKEIPMSLTCLRTASRAITPILDLKEVDLIRIEYFAEDIGVMVQAAWLLEWLKNRGM